MTAKGRELEFISWIKRDGSGTELIADQKDVFHLADTSFTLTCLSITQGTLIASGFNSYVVKLKESPK